MTKASSPHLFKHVSLLSTSDVRYDGRLYIIDHDAKTIALHHVRCLGTEGRKTGDQAIAPSSSTYEFIIFRAENIQQLFLKLSDGEYQELTNEILEPLRSGRPNINPELNLSGPRKRNDLPHRHQQMSHRDFDSHQSTHRSNEPPRGGRNRDFDDRNENRSQRISRTTLQPRVSTNNIPKRKVGLDGFASEPRYTQQRDYHRYSRENRNDYYNPRESYVNNQRYDYPRYENRSYNRSYEDRRYNQSSYQRPVTYNNDYQSGYNRSSRNQYNESYRTPYRYNNSYNRPNRTPQQYQRYYNQNNNRNRSTNYYSQNRRYNNNNNQNQNRNQNQMVSNRRQNTNVNFRGGNRPRPGTGAFLDGKRLIGEDLNFNRNSDFDFLTSNAKLERLQDTKNETSVIESNNIITTTTNIESSKVDTSSEIIPRPMSPRTATAEVENEINESKDDSKEIEESGRKDNTYVKDHFFDNLVIVTERQRREEAKKMMEENKTRRLDIDTFGNVAAQYKAVSNARPYRKTSYNVSRGNYSYNTNRRPNYNYNNSNVNYNNNRRTYQRSQAQPRYVPKS